MISSPPALPEVNVLVLVGSDRRAGDTTHLVDLAFPSDGACRLHLLDYKIDNYAYERAAIHDDFLVVAETIVRSQCIVFATPVYWYAMSGRTKVLLDRFNDLLSLRKDLGRQLTGKRVFVLSCGAQPNLPSGFTVPFSRTAAYFQMQFVDTFYAQVSTAEGFSSNTQRLARAFGDTVRYHSKHPTGS